MKPKERWMDKEAREYKKALEELVFHVETSLIEMDNLMIEPPSFEQVHKLAKIRHYLDTGNDLAMHFGLSWGWKKMAKFKKKLG